VKKRGNGIGPEYVVLPKVNMEPQDLFEITIEATNRKITAEKGRRLDQILAEAGIPLRSECGGKGSCKQCIFRHKPADHPESEWTESLACRTELQNNLILDIPARSLVNLAETIDKPWRLAKDHVLGPRALRDGYGLAIDLGTTTIAGFLCDYAHGTVAATASTRNPQVIYGADVMSRITAVAENPDRSTHMQSLVAAAIDQIAVSLCKRHDLNPGVLKDVVMVGNPTMLHIALGIDPTPIGRLPYEPSFKESRTVKAETVGLTFNPAAQLTTLPLISGFVGADVLAASLIHDLDINGQGDLLIDIGTNGEIMLNQDGHVLAASCATGPALEGASIRHGMVAVSGAITRYAFDPKNGTLDYDLIQRRPDRPVKPRGLCGSGIVSAVASLLKAGVIEPGGRFQADVAKDRLRQGSDGVDVFVLVNGEDTDSGEDIVLTQKDVRQVQLAKGAVIAGIDILCRHVNISAPNRILIAGAFGSFLDPKDLLTIGLVPAMSLERLVTVGNAAGEGAAVAALDPDFMDRAQSLAERVDVVDLAVQPDFQETFINSLAFPA
jgi:uncharacterized 2Fe-2S/4Fe-4S cluster protein (DUF4445 family)